MHIWSQNNQEVRICYAQRAKELVPFTKEALHFLIVRDKIILNENETINTNCIIQLRLEI